MTKLAEALKIIEAADPAELRAIEAAKAVSDFSFMDEVRRGVPEPSMAGQSPVNAIIIAAKEAALAAQMERDQRLSAQREPSREETIRDLSAGQAPDSVALVRASIANGG